MHRFALIASCFLFVACAGRQPEPTGPTSNLNMAGYEVASTVPDLLGSEWTGVAGDEQFDIRFGPHNVLYYTTPTGTWDNGRWKQTGARVELDMNNHFSDYEGTIDGDTIHGTARNIKGLKWTWRVTRKQTAPSAAVYDGGAT